MNWNDLKILCRIVEMVLGTALTAAAFDLIILPQGFAAGGVTGFAGILSGFCGLSLSAVVLAMNLALLLLGLVFVGRAFVAKTVALSVLFPVMLKLLAPYALTGLYGDPIVSVVLAALLLGSGAGLVLRAGASSGGFDIVAVILNRKLKVPVAVVMNLFDCGVILLQAVGRPLPQTVYGILVIMISSRVVHCVLTLDPARSRKAVPAGRRMRLAK